MKNILHKASLLTVLFMGVCFSSCSKGQEVTVYSHPEVLTPSGHNPIINDQYAGKVSLKVMGGCNSSINPDWAKNEFFISMAEETGLKFTFEVYTDNMYTEKKGLTLSTGKNLPDIFVKANFTNYDEVTYGGKTIRPLNDLIENYAPNIKEILDENPIIKKCITTTDGNIYALPTIYLNLPNNHESNMRGFFWINQAWMNECGFTELPKTPDELTQILRAFKQKKCLADGAYPLVLAGNDDLLKVFNMFGMDLIQYWVQGKEDGTIEFCPQTDKFRDCLQWLKNCIDEGLVNANWPTTTMADVCAKGSQGDYYGCFVQSGPEYVVGTAKMYDYVTLDPISQSGEGGFWGALYPVQRGCFAITYNCQYPEAAIRFADSLYDLDAPYGLWSVIGKEGIHWVWENEEHTSWKSIVSDMKSFSAKTILQTGDGMPYAVDEAFWEKQTTTSDRHTRPLRNRQMDYGKVGYPNVYFNKDDLREMSDLSADLNSYILRYIGNVLAGEKNLDSDWTEFKKFSRLHTDTYLQILQERYTDFYSSINK